MRVKLFLAVLACFAITHAANMPALTMSRKSSAKVMDTSMTNPLVSGHRSAAPRRAPRLYNDAHHVAAARAILTAPEITMDDHKKLVDHFKNITFPAKGDLFKSNWLKYRSSRANKRAEKSGSTADMAEAGYREALNQARMQEQFKKAESRFKDPDEYRSKLQLLESLERRQLSGTIQKFKELKASGSLTEEQRRKANELIKIGREKYGRAARGEEAPVDPDGIELTVE